MSYKLISPIVLIIILLIGCSYSGNDPASPSLDVERVTESSSRHLLGSWSLDVDLNNLTAKAVPLRIADAHYNVTGLVFPPYCDDCIQITVNGFDASTRILDADMTLKNWTAKTGYDVRCIVYTTDAGHELVNDDNWIGLFDISGGGYLNPFKAFAKGQTNREFTPNAQHTENFQVYIPDPPQWEMLRFAIEASWPDNCGEPYKISNWSNYPVNVDPDQSTQQLVHVYDWQANVSQVWFLCPEVTGPYPVAFYHYVYQYWLIYISNTAGAKPGTYDAMIFAYSPDEPNLPLYHMVSVTVVE